VCFTQALRNFNQSIEQILYEHSKESYLIVENGHPMTPLKQDPRIYPIYMCIPDSC